MYSLDYSIPTHPNTHPHQLVSMDPHSSLYKPTCKTTNQTVRLMSERGERAGWYRGRERGKQTDMRTERWSGMLTRDTEIKVQNDMW